MQTSPPYRLLALDVDGTLIGQEHRPSPRLCRALKNARARGIRVALCTGRPWLATQPLWESLGLITPPIVFNGALVPSADGHEPLVCEPLSARAQDLLVEEALAHDDYLEIHTARQCFVNRLGYEGHYQRAKLRIDSVVARLDALDVGESVLKAQFVLRSEAQRRRILALGPRIAPWAELSWGVSPGFDGHFVNVMHSGVDKGTTLDHLLALWGILWSEVFAAGDSPSDLSYVNPAGYGVIMGNAPQEVRDRAPHVAPPVNEDGLAQVLETVVLADGS